MEDKKVISVRKLAVIERAKALGIPIGKAGMSELEYQAREWKQSEEARKTEAQSPMTDEQYNIQDAGDTVLEGEDVGFVESRRYHADPKILKTKSGSLEGFDWKPYRSEQDEKKTKSSDLNTASVSRIARKIMAREWAAALGSRSPDNEQVIIEREAEKQRRRKAAEKENKEIEEQRLQKQRIAIEEALRTFGRKLLEITEPANPETIATIMENTFSDVGELTGINWQPDGCSILLEPWEEKKLRNKGEETMPAVFEAAIDDSLNLASYRRVENPDMLRQIRKEMFLKRILSSFRKLSVQDIHAFEDAVAEGGRIIQLKQVNESWNVKFEPWEEMRKRNIERKGKPPVVTYVIKADKGFSDISCEKI